MLRITIKNATQDEEFTVSGGQGAELGRHVTPAPGLLDIWLKDSKCSRRQLGLTQQSDGNVLVENLSSGVSIQRPSGPDVEPHSTISLVCPFSISVGSTTVNVDEIAEPTLDPNSPIDVITNSLRTVRETTNPTLLWSGPAAKPDVALSHDNLFDWFPALIAVQRSAAGSVNFYQEIADATVDLIGLHYGMVLLLTDDGWACVAANGIDKLGAIWSETVVQKAVVERRTVYGPLGDLGPVQSLAALDAVVAAPILRIDDTVAGVIYGARRFQVGDYSGDSDDPSGVSALHAQLVQLLAASAATGLARAEQEAEAAKFRSQFEDFCSPELVSELRSNPRLLEPSQREVTVLFCDIRGFTLLCERLSPTEANILTTEILDRTAECILQAEGMIIDFHGDAVAAMWNAPCVQQNHARLAVDCATQIQLTIKEMRNDARHPDRQSLRVGVGIHTGMALVGNVGGSRRLKYGPRGNTVNIASRIEGATKHLGVNVLLSAETARQANVIQPDGRRIGDIQLAGTDTTVVLVEHLTTNAVQFSREEVRHFESAITAFESGSLKEAETLLKSYLASGGSAEVDFMGRFLIEEIAKRLRNPDDEHPPHIQLHAK